MNQIFKLMVVPFIVASVTSCDGGGTAPETEPAAAQSMAEACGFSAEASAAPAAADPGGEATEERTGALFGSRANNHFWGSADTTAANNTFIDTRTTIPVCWESDNGGISSSDISAYRDAHRALIDKTWSRWARINTTGWQTCTTSSQAGIHIRLCDSSSSWTNPDGTTGTCPGGGWVGVNNNGMNGAVIDAKPNGLRFRTNQADAVFVHEFGHALGFIHEEVRHKGAGGSEFDGSYPCAGQASGSNTIYEVAQFSQPVPTLSNAVTYGGINWGTSAGNSGFPNEWSSIMAYCRNPVDRPTPYLSHYDVAGVQRIYGRRQRGTLLSTRARCTEASTSGVFLSASNCDEFNNVQEFLPVLSNFDAWNLQTTRTDGSTRCIAPASFTNGASITPQACTTGTDWRFRNMSVVGFGGMCLDLANGTLAANTPINMWSCGQASGVNQKWTRTRDGQIAFGATNWCAELDANANGRLRLQTCNASNPRQIFNFSMFGPGQISHFTGSTWECLDVAGPNDPGFHPASGYGGSNGPNGGAPVNGFSCNEAFNQRFHLSGALISARDETLCLHRDNDVAGQLLTLRTCNSSEAQVWDYYF